MKYKSICCIYPIRYLALGREKNSRKKHVFTFRNSNQNQSPIMLPKVLQLLFKELYQYFKFFSKKAILKLNFEKKICLKQHSEGKLRKDEKKCIGRFLSYQKYRFLGRKRFSYKKHFYTL